MDVEDTYVQSPVEEELYMRQPKGFVQRGRDGKDLVCRLRKSLYGLRQSASNWHSVIHKWMIEYGLPSSKAGPFVYVLRKGNDVVVIALYVDT
jgi:hypothetical protein